MKRVLITGANSYVGTKVEKWLKRMPADYEIFTLDMQDSNWNKYEFSGFDVVFHVAGIAHRKDAPEELYENVNHQLAYQVAKKARDAHVGQFIFMSSGAVYTQSDRKHQIINVNEESACNPVTPYGKSKKAAEDDMRELFLESNCRLAILRPPTIYGKGAKGNYNALSLIAKRTPIFPKVHNERSMIYIDNFCEFVRLLIDSEGSGVFLPQNRDYVNISALVRIIASCHGKKIVFTRGFNWLIWIMSYGINSINKMFGTYKYEQTIYFGNKYQVVDFEDSVIQTEK